MAARLSTRAKRLGLVAGYAAPPGRLPDRPDPGGTWTSADLGRCCTWTASSSGGSPGPRERCGCARIPESPQIWSIFESDEQDHFDRTFTFTHPVPIDRLAVLCSQPDPCGASVTIFGF
jgi:hypothetical protein